MNGLIICNKLSKNYGKFFYNPYLIVELSNRHIHEISLFFALPTYVEIILMR